MLEFLLEFLLEIGGEVILEAVVELGIYGLADPFRKTEPFQKEWRVNPGWAIFGFVLMGLLGGALSVWMLPMNLLKNPLAQYINLAVTPILLGLLFEWLGRRRERQGKRKMLLDRFSYGFVFALTMGLVRFYFAA